MAMNPRLLRPTANDSPASISGLALWLDAAAADALYTTDAGPVTAVSSPLDLAGCALWLDGADSSAASMTLDGTSLDAWKDKSGNGRDFTAAGAARPTLTAAGLNGLSVVTLDGNDQMTNATNIVGLTSVSMFAVAFNDGSQFGGVISSTAGTDSSPGLLVDQFHFACRGLANLSRGTSGSGPIVATGIVSSGASAVFYGGLQADADAASGSLAAVTTTAIGTYRQTAANFLTGYIAEIVIFNTALSTTDRARVEAYLAAKWGISGVHKSVAEEQSAVASPLELGGCMGWWDASESSTITLNGANVSEWRDRSGLGRHVSMATEANQPAYVASSLNGKGGIDWGTPGSSKRLSRESLSFTARDFFIVADFDGGATFSNFETLLTPSGIAVPIGGDGAGTVAWRQFATSDRVILNNVASSSTALPAISSPFVLQSTYTAASAASACTALHFGQFATFANRGWGGKIYEVVIFDRDLTSVESARVAKYLQQKWSTPTVPDPTPPVGYWRDRSGNGRHATQSTAASRPVVGTQNGRKALSANGTSQWMSMPNALGVARNVPGLTIVAALNPNTASGARSAAFWSVGASTSARALLQFENAAARAGGRRNDLDSFDSATAGVITANQPMAAIASLDYANATATAFVNGVAFAEDASFLTAGNTSDTDSQAASIMSSAGSFFYSGVFAELAAWPRVLTLAERRKMERYLARRWGITLAPQVSNAEAQDWINRVYANGGTVSTSTASAVSTFCDAIEAAGIRDRFYRMGIFAGDNLNAALVPLYRGPTFGGTTYGNATDTNNGPFVSGDYTETGSTGGLTPNGTSKYLATGLNPFDAGMVETDFHTSGYFREAINTSGVFIGCVNSSAQRGVIFHPAYQAIGMYVRFGGLTNSGIENGTLSARTGLLLGVRRPGGAGFRNGSNINATSVTSGSLAWNDSSASPALFVFARNDATGSPSLQPFTGRSQAYSIGLSMTDQQAADFHTAMQAFQTALGRA
jgi:hypothetical protein